MRVLLFTGKGGVGKTTVAAATAAHAAAQGRKTLVISTDAAHSLGDAFGAEAGGEPVEVDTGLLVQQVDTQRRFEETWRDVQAWLVSVLDEGVLPDTLWVRGSARAHVAYALDQRTSTVLAMGAIDNLAKGASAQAIQALNVALGWPDATGLPEVAIFP